MDDPNITMEEYIRLEKEKAQRHGRTFNWQTATYGKVKYCEDEDDCFTNFETEFPAIVFDDILTSDVTLSCEPMVSPLNKNKNDFRISFNESNEDYMEIFDNNSFSYKIISADNLKTDSKNDNDKVDMPSFLLPSLRYQVKGYTKDIVHDFEQRLEMISGRSVNRVHVLDFAGLTNEIRGTLADRLMVVYTKDYGQELFTSHAWRRLFEIRGPLVREFILEFFSTCKMSGTEMGLDVTDTLCFQLGVARRILRGGRAELGYPRATSLGVWLLILVFPGTKEAAGFCDWGLNAHDVVQCDQAVLAPVQVPQPPPPALARNIAQRLSTLEDEVHSLRGDMGK
nr:hypothetical protein [Tanacetum cinerariifolium]